MPLDDTASPRSFVTAVFSAIPAPHAASSSNPLTSIGVNGRNLLLTLHVLYPNEFLAALDLLDRGLVTRFKITNDSLQKPAGIGGQRESGQAWHLSQGQEASNSMDDLEMTDDTGNATVANLLGSSNSRAQSTGNAPGSCTSHSNVYHDRPQVFYVRSAQQRSSRFSSTSIDNPSSYEVRLDSWNCSCPAFAFAAFPSVLPRTEASPGPESSSRPSTGYASAHPESIKAEWEFGGVSQGPVPVCKHLLACVLVDRSELFSSFVEESTVEVDEAVGWAAGWGA